MSKINELFKNVYASVAGDNNKCEVINKVLHRFLETDKDTTEMTLSRDKIIEVYGNDYPEELVFALWALSPPDNDEVDAPAPTITEPETALVMTEPSTALVSNPEVSRKRPREYLENDDYSECDEENDDSKDDSENDSDKDDNEGVESDDDESEDDTDEEDEEYDSEDDSDSDYSEYDYDYIPPRHKAEIAWWLKACIIANLGLTVALVIKAFV